VRIKEESEMENYKHILCAVDFSPLSDSAAKRAVALARQTGANVTFLHVIEYFPEDRSNEVIAPECTDPAEYRESEARKGLRGLVTRLEFPDAFQEVLFNTHAAWHEIVKYAGVIGCDLIVLGCHGHHGVGTLLGSSANGVINHAPCDVLAVRPHD
jgi:universal stress protein A